MTQNNPNVFQRALKLSKNETLIEKKKDSTAAF